MTEIVVSGFGPFPGVPRNATAELVEALAAEPDVRSVVLPVECSHAAHALLEVVARESPRVVLMSGVARSRQPLWVEAGASNLRSARADAAGREPPPTRQPRSERRATIDVDLAAAVARDGLARRADVLEGDVRFGDVLTGCEVAAVRDDNAYVCNDLTYRVLEALSGAELRVGFLHWPSELRDVHVAAAAAILREIARALNAR